MDQYDNITKYVLNVKWQLGVRDYYDYLAHEGTMTITLDNQDSLFHPDNEDSQFYGMFRQNLRSRLEVWHFKNQKWVTVWTGFTFDFKVNIGLNSERKVQVECKQGLYSLQNALFKFNPTDAESHGSLLNFTDLWKAVTDDTGLKIASFDTEDDSDIQEGAENYYYMGDGWNASTKTSKAIQDILMSEHYRLFIDRQGKYVGRNRYHFLNFNQDSELINVGDSNGANYEYTSEIINEVEIFFNYKTIEEAEVWNSKTFIRCPANGDSDPILLNFQFEEGGVRSVDNTTLNFNDIVWETYHNISSVGSNDLQDLNLSINLTGTKDGRTFLSVANGNSFSVFTRISGIKGDTIVGGHDDSFLFRYDESIANNDLTKRKVVTSKLITDYWQAKALAEVFLALDAEPAGEYTDMVWISRDKYYNDLILDRSILDHIKLKDRGTSSLHVILGEEGSLIAGRQLKMKYYMSRMNKEPFGKVGEQLPIRVGV